MAATTEAEDRRLSLLEAPGQESTVRDWLAAWGGPIVAVAVSDAPEQRRLGRIISNAVSERSQLGPSLRDSTARADQRLLRGLAAVLAPVDEQDLRFRLSVMVTVLVGLSGPASDDARRAAQAAPGRLDARVLDVLEAIVRAAPTPS